jgi:hypothetical protein
MYTRHVISSSTQQTTTSLPVSPTCTSFIPDRDQPCSKHNTISRSLRHRRRSCFFAHLSPPPPLNMPPFALVTGGNRGLGLKVVQALVNQGKPVLLTARNVEQGREVAASLSTPAVQVRVLQLDAADSSSIQALADVVRADYNQQIDLVVRIGCECADGGGRLWCRVCGCRAPSVPRSERSGSLQPLAAAT